MQKDVPPPATPLKPARGLAMDSAEYLLAAYPVLTAIAKYTGLIGLAYLGKTYITRKIIAGKDKEATRNAAIMVAAAFTMFLIIIACMIWLASLP
jgi:hypothetical protein